ncbi:single-stranded-DNA-specific exonuclease RecJ [Ferviditalea candida]|uniref:Single-stranded-DNA-specific exonuclease RecJ n=1 Tax=Ferviditalea candida TaxID=3108399 RepID=A0ABU5ZK17_9BACL|nr:single-stranded-DNA-specific exonuclease RecJ [Paenibacillaceae bacterium T2]
MLRPKAKWNFQNDIRHQADVLADKLNISPLLAKLLAVRGISDVCEAEQFLFGGHEQFHDPFLLNGMKEAVERIRRALSSGEKIRIYGDYDADGVSGTSLMFYLLRMLGADFDYYIPHRLHEGYGLNPAALDDARHRGVSLLITVDNGISAVEEVEYARSLNIDVIVTDHHEPPELLPDAYSVINPKKPGCGYPFKHLAGAGVAFKLAQALLGRLPEELLEIAAIGTVADLMPLNGENRIMVKLGLERMRNSGYKGIRALCRVSNVDIGVMNATHIGYALAPRINAAGRLEHAAQAVQLLTADNEQQAEHAAVHLDMLNRERQRLADEMTQEAFEQIKDGGDAGRKVLVVSKEGWNVGIVGIVASKVLEEYYRPTLVLSIDPDTGTAKGSARSIPGFDIRQALAECGELLDHYGGHQAAAGMTLPVENLPHLAYRLNRIAEEWLSEEDLIPNLSADLECRLEDVNLETIRQIGLLEPFGTGNPSPRFVMRELKLSELRTIGKDGKHLKMTMLSPDGNNNGAAKEAVGFGFGGLSELISSSSNIDILGEMSVNEWNGIRKPQIILQDMRILQVQVFDWRNKRDASPDRLGLLLDKLRGMHPLSGEQAFIVSDASKLELLPIPLRSGDASVWSLTPDGNFAPHNRWAERMKPEGIKTALVYTLPNQLEQMEAALGRLTSLTRIYAIFADADSGLAPIPSREMFKKVYASIAQQGSWPADDKRMLESLGRRTGLSESTIRMILEIFEELVFIERIGARFHCIPQPQKRDLASSIRYRQSLLRSEVEKALVFSTADELTEWFLSRLGHSQTNNLLTEEIV